MNTKNSRWIIRPIVPEEVYTDREEFLEYFHNAALAAAKRRTMSTVLLGQRRMGKTEIFKRVVNRLFFGQDPQDPKAVVPVYYSFPDAPMEKKEFAAHYLENFVRHYVGFRTGRPDLVRDSPQGEELISLVEEVRSAFPFTRTLDLMIRKYRAVASGVTLPQKTALETPRRISDIDDSTIVMFLDEFQNTRLPQYGFDIAGFMQEAVESPTCPHFVTGSAMSILTKEIIGRGSLFGRFDAETIEAMSGYWGKELASNAARYHKAEISGVMAPVVAERCGGNPFYINAVVRQAAKLREPVSDEKTLNKILAVDVTSGFIWGELNDQVTRWIERINDHKITKWILYLSALEENEEKDKKNRLNLERIREEVKRREGTDVPLETIRDVLIRLSRGDLLEYLEMGDWFRRVKDPILLEFLRVWGRIEVEGHEQRRVQEELVEEYGTYRRRISEYKGYLAEVHMSQILLDSQNRTLPGRFFNSPEDVEMPWRFFYVRHRMRIGSGKGREIDLLGAAGSEKWVCQSKWVTGGKIGVRVLRELTAQADIVRKDMNPRVIRLWIFAHDGLSGPARKFAQENGILWSSRKEFDELLVHLGLRPLPDL
ncbi:hypothetical protein [Desulfonema magnum]|uniref:P-loop containing n=1 Tax=Desulfonema magnum TaxID=45655 RepID=A0A975BJ44_9BACT|nr:hypothetical protein [Desulfonema magnum]QTA86318.1 p-loop containing [Desulfonema magnum]